MSHETRINVTQNTVELLLSSEFFYQALATYRINTKNISNITVVRVEGTIDEDDYEERKTDVKPEVYIELRANDGTTYRLPLSSCLVDGEAITLSQVMNTLDTFEFVDLAAAQYPDDSQPEPGRVESGQMGLPSVMSGELPSLASISDVQLSNAKHFEPLCAELVRTYNTRWQAECDADVRSHMTQNIIIPAICEYTGEDLEELQDRYQQQGLQMLIPYFDKVAVEEKFNSHSRYMSNRILKSLQSDRRTPYIDLPAVVGEVNEHLRGLAGCPLDQEMVNALVASVYQNLVGLDPDPRFRVIHAEEMKAHVDNELLDLLFSKTFTVESLQGDVAAALEVLNLDRQAADPPIPNATVPYGVVALLDSFGKGPGETVGVIVASEDDAVQTFKETHSVPLKRVIMDVSKDLRPFLVVERELLQNPHSKKTQALQGSLDHILATYGIHGVTEVIQSSDQAVTLKSGESAPNYNAIRVDMPVAELMYRLGQVLYPSSAPVGTHATLAKQLQSLGMQTIDGLNTGTHDPFVGTPYEARVIVPHVPSDDDSLCFAVRRFDSSKLTAGSRKTGQLAKLINNAEGLGMACGFTSHGAYNILQVKPNVDSSTLSYRFVQQNYPDQFQELVNVDQGPEFLQRHLVATEIWQHIQSGTDNKEENLTRFRDSMRITTLGMLQEWLRVQHRPLDTIAAEIADSMGLKNMPWNLGSDVVAEQIWHYIQPGIRGNDALNKRFQAYVQDTYDGLHEIETLEQLQDWVQHRAEDGRSLKDVAAELASLIGRTPSTIPAASEGISWDTLLLEGAKQPSLAHAHAYIAGATSVPQSLIEQCNPYQGFLHKVMQDYRVHPQQPVMLHMSEQMQAYAARYGYPMVDSVDLSSPVFSPKLTRDVIRLDTQAMPAAMLLRPSVSPEVPPFALEPAAALPGPPGLRRSGASMADLHAGATVDGGRRL